MTKIIVLNIADFSAQIFSSYTSAGRHYDLSAYQVKMRLKRKQLCNGKYYFAYADVIKDISKVRKKTKNR